MGFGSAWDATVKVWAMLPAGIDPQPVAEFFEHEKQIQSVHVDDRGTLVAAS
jgi:hypothetical protein